MSEVIELMMQALFVPMIVCFVIAFVSIVRILFRLMNRRPGVLSVGNLSGLSRDVQDLQSGEAGDPKLERYYRHVQVSMRWFRWLFAGMLVLFLIRFLIGVG